ncbi:hypothetical protein KI688_012521 [Linnemannia hyalina]|uniref:Ndc10 domain-containing protein n=1 Tax=Linnemannia hyalina TaxID=64524 RepID=A0A9P7XUU1_9FUNG|nr:hypothetical protein KI688_012521 [Linnemannia hyalina]
MAEWCTRKKYTDGHRVTPEKYVTYIRELTARDEYYDKENPHLCIKPFIAHIHIHRGANAHRASKGTVLEALKAIRALYLDQCIVENVEPNVHRDLAKTSIDVIMSNYEKLLKECPGLPRIITPDGQVLQREKEHQQNENQEVVQQKPENLEAYSQENEHQGVLRYDTPREDVQPEDVQQEDVRQGDVEVEDVQEGDVQEEDVQEENVQEETIQKMNPQVSGRNKEPSIIQLKMVMKSLWNPQTKLSSRGHSWMIAHRERLRLAFGYFETDSRNDFATLSPPQLHHLQIRPEDKDQIPTQGVAVTLHSRKRYGDPSRYSIFLREEDVQVCPIGALAFFLLGKWTEKKSFPNFGSDNWATEPIEFLKDAPKAGENTRQVTTPDISEQDGGANSAALFAKVIEANTEERPYSSFFSLLNPSPTRYQNSTKVATPAILTTTLPQPSVFHLPRSRLLLPPDLQRQLFPFIEDFYDDSADWKMWVENIMMDRPDATDRLPNKDKDVKYVNLDFPKIRYLLFVAGLRKVVLQDFAAMMACEPEEDGERKTGFDHTFAVKHPVLSSSAFREFAAQLQEAMVADAVVEARVPTKAQELAEDEEVQSFEVQETVQASTKTTTQTETTTTTRPVTRKGKENQSRVSTLDLTASSTDVVQVPVATGSHNLHNGTDSLLEVIQELCARVASLEQMEKQESEFATPASATTLLADTLSRDKDTSMDMDSNMDVNMDEDAANGALRNNDTSHSKDNDVDRLRRENQSLRNKLAALERVNLELAEENQRQSSLSCTPEPHVLSIPPAVSATPSRVVSRASYELGRAPNGRLGRRKNDSNIVSATCSTPKTVIQGDHTTTTIAAASIAPINTHNNNHTDIKERHRSHSATSTSTCETSMLRQEVQDLRSQLASLEQEEQGALNYAAVAIESVEFLDNKILQIEQSMHGLWTMIARNEATKFASAGSGGPRSPAMGMAAAPPPPLSPLHQQHQQRQYQDPSGRASVEARLRVDTLPLRGRVVSSAVAASAASGSGASMAK